MEQGATKWPCCDVETVGVSEGDEDKGAEERHIEKFDAARKERIGSFIPNTMILWVMGAGSLSLDACRAHHAKVGEEVSAHRATSRQQTGGSRADLHGQQKAGTV